MYSENSLQEKFNKTRALTEKLMQPLEVDDYNMQSMTEASPPKWNLGHTTWFFELLVVEPFLKNYTFYDERLLYCFNSYYETAGDRLVRNNRHTLNRPTVEEVYKYRHHVTEAVNELFDNFDSLTGQDKQEVLFRLEMGINHEEQHIELFLTDFKHILFNNPLKPVYIEKELLSSQEAIPAGFIEYEETITHIGHNGDGFAFDNEKARHKVLLNPFALMDRPVTNAEFLEFVESGGYNKFQYWLSDGWATVNSRKWEHPLYWMKQDNKWYEFTLHGIKPLNMHAPVCHISLYEANAYASFKQARLPSEAEWEYAASTRLEEVKSGHFLENEYYHPIPFEVEDNKSAGAFFGNIWELTHSAYLPYPHFRVPEGALSEYNGKFMNDQRVLRGGSCATPRNHIRLTYRNFFQSDKRWQFSGFRLAKDI